MHHVTSYVALKKYLFEKLTARKGERVGGKKCERRGKREIPPGGSLPTWPQWLDQTRAWSFIQVSSVGGVAQTLGPLSPVFPSVLAGSCI